MDPLLGTMNIHVYQPNGRFLESVRKPEKESHVDRENKQNSTHEVSIELGTLQPSQSFTYYSFDFCLLILKHIKHSLNSELPLWL